jgi:type I restriction enzyme S subunit
MIKWHDATVGDFFDLVSGYAFKSADFIDQGIPVIKIKNVKAGKFSEHTFSYVSPDFLEMRADKVAKPDDLLISMSGNRHDGSPETWVGKVAHFRKANTYFINQRVGALRIKPDKCFDIRFAGFLLSSFPYQELFISIATSSGGQANLSPNQILNAPIHYPDFHSQCEIGGLLGALDDKIELNRQMNETLEATARLFFKDYFVDFGPTRAKAEGRPPYLAPELWALFPGALDDDDKPVGWDLTNLSSITSELRRGISPKYIDEGGVRVLNQKCIRDRTVSFVYARRHDQNAKSVSGREIVDGDILVNSTGVGTLGRVAQIWNVEEPTVVDSHVTVVRADKAKVSAAYLGINLTSRESEIESLGEGSTGQTELSRVRLGMVDILLPDRKVLTAFDETVGELIQMSVKNQGESYTLANTRDFLLPKLMSGEIRLRDAEKVVEGVL